MTSKTDTFKLGSRAWGHVCAKWVSDNAERGLIDTHNIMSFSAADVLAAAYGGDTSKVPKYVGFVYAVAADQVMPPLTRDMTWQSLREFVKSIGGNIQVVRFNRKPTISVAEVVKEESNDTDLDAKYTGNIVEFHAVTRSGIDGVYAEDTSLGSVFAGRLTQGMTIYRAVLLGDGTPCDEQNKYTVLAMVDMAKNGRYRQKPESYELAVDWRVTFE